MVHSLGSVIAIVILISVITPGFLGAGVVISVLYWLIGAFYLRASRDLKRLESIQRSPLYQHFGETLTGVSTIRAYGDERRFVRDNLAKIDAHNRPFFYLWCCNRWLGFRVDIAGALVSFFAGVFVVISAGRIDAGLAGLSLTYAITFTDNILWVVRLYALNEQNMNSVERIREYLEVEQEAAEIIPDNRSSTDWPEAGAVTFSDYSTRYRPDLDRVLKHVSFDIKPLEKVGIVGRTGAGKSSLALALFRSLEAETGKIVIDGVDISTIGLQDLRQSITMVPQDPTLFTGTIRSNLDPFGVYTDSEIFGALKRVQLINEVPEVAAPVVGDDAAVNKNIFLDLQSSVAESGNNLSQGQKYYPFFRSYRGGKHANVRKLDNCCVSPEHSSRSLKCFLWTKQLPQSTTAPIPRFRPLSGSSRAPLSLLRIVSIPSSTTTKSSCSIKARLENTTTHIIC